MITDTEARRIASLWCNDHAPALQAFWSTGAINTARADHDLSREITQITMTYRNPYESGYVEWRAGMKDLGRLQVYVYAHEPRAAVAGWSALPLDPSPQEQSR